jgi:hypothetical protein
MYQQRDERPISILNTLPFITKYAIRENGDANNGKISVIDIPSDKLQIAIPI